MFAQVKDGSVVQVIPRPVPLTINEIQYPKNIFQIWNNSWWRGWEISGRMDY